MLYKIKIHVDRHKSMKKEYDIENATTLNEEDFSCQLPLVNECCDV